MQNSYQSRTVPATLTQTDPQLAALEPVGDELISRGHGVLYWQVARGDTLGSAISKTMGKKRYKSSTTTRNLRTVEKVLAAA